MDAASLLNVLLSSASPDEAIRTRSFEQLTALKESPGYLPALFQLCCDDLEEHVRLATAIEFKNYARRRWKSKKASKRAKVAVVCEADRQVLRGGFVPAFIGLPPQVRKQLLPAFDTMVSVDFPKRWPSLVSDIGAHMVRERPYDMLGAIQLVRRVLRAFSFHAGAEKRDVPNDVSAAVLPVLLPLLCECVERLRGSCEQDGYALCQAVLQVLYEATAFDFPPCLQTEPEQLRQWMVALSELLTREPPAELLQRDGPVSDEEHRASAFWKCKKWVLQMYMLWFARYSHAREVQTDAHIAMMNEEAAAAEGMPSSGGGKSSKHRKGKKKKKKAFSAAFSSAFFGGMFQDALTVLSWYNAEQQQRGALPRTLLTSIIQFLSTGLCVSAIYKAMKTSLGDIVQGVLFPAICFGRRDAELWEMDERELVRSQEEMFTGGGESLDPRTAALHFIVDMCSIRVAHLEPTVAMAAGVICGGDAQPPERVFGAVLVLGAVSMVMRAHEAFLGEAEQVLATRVPALLAGPQPYVRARAAWLVARFSWLPMEQTQAQRQAALQGIVSLLGDVHMPVRLRAALALSAFFDEPFVAQLLAPMLDRVLTVFFELMDEVESEELVMGLQLLIRSNEAAMAPHALQLSGSLMQRFFAYAEDKDDELAALAACQCLAAIRTVIYACAEPANDGPERDEPARPYVPIGEREPNALVEGIAEVLAPFREYLARAEVDDDGFVSEILVVLSMLTWASPRITPCMWSFFPVLYDLFMERGGPESLEDLLPVLDNFIDKGRAHFASDAAHWRALVTMYERVMSANYAEGSGYGGDDDPVAVACQLAEVALQVFRGGEGGVLDAMPALVGGALARLQLARRPKIRTACLEVLLNACYCHAAAAERLLASADALGAFCDALLTTPLALWHRHHDKKVYVLGVTALLFEAGPVAGRSAELRENMPRLLNALLRMVDEANQQCAEMTAADEEKERHASGAGGDGGYEGDEDEEEGGMGPFRGVLDDDEDFEGGLGDFEQLIKHAQAARMRDEEGRRGGGLLLDDNDDGDDDIDEEDAFFEAMLDMNDNVLDDDEDDVDRPIDDVDECVQFAEKLHEFASVDAEGYQALMSAVEDREMLREVCEAAEHVKRVIAEAEAAERAALGHRQM